MADNMNFFGKIAALLGSGIKNLFRPLQDAFGKPGAGSREKSRLAKYLESFGASDTGQESAGTTKSGESGGANTSLQKVEENADALSRNLQGATDRASVPGGSMKGTLPGLATGMLQAESALDDFTFSLADNYDKSSSFTALKNVASRTGAASAYITGAASTSPVQIEFGKYMASLEDPMSSDVNGTKNSLASRWQSLAGLNPLGMYFEGYSAPVASASSGYYTAPPIIPPAPAGGGNDQPVNAKLEVKSTGPRFRSDPADMDAAIERHERNNIHRMMAASNNSGGY